MYGLPADMLNQASSSAEVFNRYTKQARALGCVNLAQGIPENCMQASIDAALPAACSTGWQYVDPRGLESLREAIATRVYGGAFEGREVLVTSGCTESLAIALMALAAAGFGPSVAYLEPFYPYYPGFAGMAGLRGIAIRMRPGRPQPDFDALAQQLAAGARIVLLNTPHNPTGWVLEADDARALRALLDRHGAFLVLDEAYRTFVYDARHASAVDILLRENPQVLVAGAFSKLFSATGLRLGWLAGEASVLDRAYALHMHLTYCQPGPLQSVVVALLEQRSDADSRALVSRYQAKRDRLLAGLLGAGLECSAPAGGHFITAQVNGASSEGDLALAFAEARGVMALPTGLFYSSAPPRTELRFSFAVAPDTVALAVDRLRQGSQELRA